MELEKYIYVYNNWCVKILKWFEIILVIDWLNVDLFFVDVVGMDLNVFRI